jgi:hypothetical protein
MSRQTKIFDHSNDFFWKEELKDKLGTQPYKKKTIDELYSVLNNTNLKFKTVESVVNDMKERSGLSAYLNKNKKIASNNEFEPTVIQQYPQIKITIENFIKDTNGNLPVPAILNKIKAIHKNDISDNRHWDEEKLLRFISNLNLQAKSKSFDTTQSSFLGKLDLKDMDETNMDSNDFLGGLTNSKI